MTGWFALVAPAGTPATIVHKAHRDVNAIVGERDFAERVAAIGPVADGSMDLDQVNAFLRAEHARWAAATLDIGALPE
jgi:tripartite-type tricarboxylate transporter receptor subunit TctC